jgi:hypothetical protein
MHCLAFLGCFSGEVWQRISFIIKENGQLLAVEDSIQGLTSDHPTSLGYLGRGFTCKVCSDLFFSLTRPSRGIISSAQILALLLSACSQEVSVHLLAEVPAARHVSPSQALHYLQCVSHARLGFLVYLFSAAFGSSI